MSRAYITHWNGSQLVRTGAGSDPGTDPDPDPGNPGEPGPDSLYRPIQFSTLAEAREALGAPVDATYVMWNDNWSDLEEAFTATPAGSILVLPEREEPYWIDSSKGFMASGVESVDGTGPDGLKDGSRVPIVSQARLWFAMARARRGILGMGPGVTISPTDSGFTAPRQPIHQNEPVGNRFTLRYMLNGTTAQMVGAMEKLIEVEHINPFFANFRLTGRDFGGIGYSGISSLQDSVSDRLTTIKRVFFDGCWRGHAGVPNGENAALGMLRGRYLIENCDFRSEQGSSPIMWNRNNGGTVRQCRSSRPNVGMWTFWESGGVNVFEDVHLFCDRTGLNIEDNQADFEFYWNGGSMTLAGEGSRFHLNINPKYGTIKAHLTDVECSPNGYTPNTMSAHIYGTMGVQRRADVSHNSYPVAYLPSSAWIN